MCCFLSLTQLMVISPEFFPGAFSKSEHVFVSDPYVGFVIK